MLTILVLVFVAGILAGFLQSIDYDALRDRPRGVVSVSGLALVVGGGFAVGFAYGAVTGAGEGGWTWLFRGLTVGGITAAAGAFYLASQQRRDERGRKERRGDRDREDPLDLRPRDGDDVGGRDDQ